MRARSSFHAKADFDWMQGACYEPAPLPYRQRRRKVRWVFTILAALVIVGCGLAGLSHA